MTREPAVSVCVPTWNGAPYLRECLSSLLAQTWGDYEILLLDDGSADATLEIAAGFREPRLTIHRNPCRLGLPGNWNRCLELARGRLVKFLFQDDSLAPTALEELVHALDRPSGPVLSFCRREIRHDAGLAALVLGEDYTRYLQAFYDELGDQVTGLDLVLAWARVGRPLSTNVVGEPSFVLFRRDAARAVGGFDVRFSQLADWDLWLRLASHAPLAFVDQILGVFRVHAGGESVRNFGRPCLQRDHFLLLGNLLREYGPVLPPEVCRTLGLRRWRAGYHWAKDSLLGALSGRSGGNP